jgi:anti-sigma B factor antagonist
MHAEMRAVGVTEESVTDDAMISQERIDGVALVTVRGEIDLASSSELRTCLHGLCASDSTAVAVDLRGVTFLDSSALGVLVGALRRCRENERDFRLIIDSPRLLKIFDITGLTSVFEISETLN